MARLGRWIAGASVVGITGVTITLLVITDITDLSESFILNAAMFGIGIGALAWVAFPLQARNATVWVFTVSAALTALGVLSGLAGILIIQAAMPGVSLREILAMSPSEMPVSAALALQPSVWTEVPSFMLVLTVGLQVFPDGKPLSARWRWVVRASVGLVIAFAVLFGLASHPLSTTPIGSESFPGFVGALMDVLSSVALAVIGLSIVSLVLRYRRGSQETRHQIRWIAIAGLGLLAVLPVSGPQTLWLLLIAEAALIAAFAIAITRYKVYAVDIVISKVVTYGSLALLIAILYAVSVSAFIFAFAGWEQRDLGLVLPMGATVLVALAFEPLRRRLQKYTNRLVYGRRAAPAEVLSDLADQLDDVSIAADLAGLATLLREGTAADEAIVWLRVGEEFRAVAASPHEAVPDKPEIGSASDLPQSSVELSVEVTHAGETLGALQIRKSRAHAVTTADRVLLDDVAAGAALLMRNLRLNAELAERAQQLEASRRRLIAAQDAVRHRLERDLHDGAQQQVVALKVKLGLARSLAQREGLDAIGGHLEALSEETDQAVAQMRRIARGIYPPLLEAEGLATALGAVQRTFERPVQVSLSDIGRHSRQVEETVYFGVITAISASLTAGATSVDVAIKGVGGWLEIVVGSDLAATPDTTALVDRFEALGGEFEVRDSRRGVEFVASVPTDLEPAETGT